ncbi:MAG: hypothetical protein J6V44_15740 [Methanobrevibacter sp.]|nr:hypothetical protein [Methanobrevibacter sp.]MBO7692155.1 hypothetical protein [Methanobrevibacter sp.]
MNIVELKKSIDTGTFTNLYIFYGEEYTILEEYIKMIKNKIGCECKSCESVSIIYKTLNSKSLFGSGKCLYIVRDDKEFLTAEQMWDIERKLKQKGITIIAKYGNIDQRSKFSKKFSDNMTSFDRLSENILAKYIKKDIDINNDNCEYLINVCNGDYGRIKLEIDKLVNACEYFKLKPDDCFRMCKSADLFYVEPEGEAFELVDSIMTRNYKTIYQLLEKSKRRNDNCFLIFTLLHTNVKQVLQLQLAGNQGDTQKATGLNGFQIKSAMKYVNRYSCEELVRFLKYIKYCDSGIKQGTISEDMALDYLLVNVL